MVIRAHIFGKPHDEVMRVITDGKIKTFLTVRQGFGLPVAQGWKFDEPLLIL